MLRSILKGVAIIGAIVTFGGIAFFLIIEGPLEDLDAAERRHLGLKEEYLHAYRLSMNLDLLRQQLAEVKKLHQTVTTILPDADGVEVRRQELEDSIRAAAANTRLESSLEMSIGNSVLADFYAYRPFSISISGEFKDVVAFLQQISTGSEQLRMLKKVSLQPRLPSEGIALTVEAYAFAYLGEEAVAAQRRAKSRREAKKKTG